MGVLSKSPQWRYRAHEPYSGYTDYQREYSIGRTVSADERQEFLLRLVCGQPGASLLPDVAAGELQRGARELGQSFRLQPQAVLLGGSDGWSGCEWRSAAATLQS